MSKELRRKFCFTGKVILQHFFFHYITTITTTEAIICQFWKKSSLVLFRKINLFDQSLKRIFVNCKLLHYQDGKSTTSPPPPPPPPPWIPLSSLIAQFYLPNSHHHCHHYYSYCFHLPTSTIIGIITSPSFINITINTAINIFTSRTSHYQNIASIIFEIIIFFYIMSTILSSLFQSKSHYLPHHNI